MVRGRSQKKTNKDVQNVLKDFYKEKQNLKVKEARKAIKSVYKGNDIKKKLKLVNEIRELIFNDMFMLPSISIRIAIVFMILWITFCIILSVIYGISFDVLYQNDGFSFDNIKLFNNGNNNALNINLNPFSQDCFNNDILLDISNRVSDEDIEQKNSALYSYISAFGNNISDAGSWLTSLFISIILSIFIWQPLTVYFVTWIKIWAFTWDLRVRSAPGTIKRLCCFVCGCRKPSSLDHNRAVSSLGDAQSLGLPSIKDGQETFPDTNDLNWMDENAKLFTMKNNNNGFEMLGATSPTTGENTNNNNNNSDVVTPTADNTRTPTAINTPTIGDRISLKPGGGRSTRTDVVVRNERPMDILSFYSHDILFINDEDVYDPNRNDDNELVSTVKHIEMHKISKMEGDIDTNNNDTELKVDNKQASKAETTDNKTDNIINDDIDENELLVGNHNTKGGETTTDVNMDGIVMLASDDDNDINQPNNDPTNNDDIDGLIENKNITINDEDIINPDKTNTNNDAFID